MGGHCSECGSAFGSAEEFNAHLEPVTVHRFNQYYRAADVQGACSAAGAAIFVTGLLRAPPSTSSEMSLGDGSEESSGLSLTEEPADSLSGSDSSRVRYMYPLLVNRF